MHFQAKKRKLGLVEDEDTKTEEGYGEGKKGDDSIRVVNVRGEWFCAFDSTLELSVVNLFYIH